MVLRINPARMPVWRTPDELQVGTGVNQLRIKGLNQAQQRLVTLLMRGIAEKQFDVIAEEIGLDDAEEFLTKLKPAMLETSQRVAALDRDYVERNFAELCRIQARWSSEPSLVIEQRRSQSVFVDDAPWRELLVNALLDSGVGSVFDSTGKTKRRDLAAMAITIDHSAHRPQSHRTWLALGVPQVAILFDQTGVSISPVIEVGITPCLSCLQSNQGLEQIGIDSQLLFSNQRFDDSVAKHFAIAMAVQLTLARIDSVTDFAAADFHRVGYRLDSNRGTIHELTWQFNQSCWCHLKTQG